MDPSLAFFCFRVIGERSPRDREPVRSLDLSASLPFFPFFANKPPKRPFFFFFVSALSGVFGGFDLTEDGVGGSLSLSSLVSMGAGAGADGGAVS
jgi:hypothetical protein